MSWLSGLASRTENLLNSLDESAASVLTKAKTANGVNSKPSYRYDTESVSPMLAASPRAALSQPTPARTPSHGSAPAASPSRRPGRADPEEQLIAFLNDSSTPAKPSSGHSRQSSVSSVVSVGNFLSVASGQETAPTPPAPAAPADTAISIPTGGAPSVENGNHSESDQLRMLQREISNLNREMAQLLQRAKLGEKECTKLKYQLSTANSQVTETERQCRHLQQRDADLQESLKAKDGQLALLKVRLDEADGELRSRQAAVDRLQLENDRILQSSSDTSGQQSGTIQGLQDRLHEAEARIRQEQHALTAAQQGHDRRLEQLSAERETLTSELTSARQQLQQQQSSGAELQRQLADSRQLAQSTAAELAEYKLKAQRILQSKDQLISRLKEGSGGSDGDSSDLVQAELEQVRSERELAQTEVHKLAARVQQLRDELQHVESAAAEEAQAAGEALREAETREAAETRLRQELEKELESAQQELRYMREDMVQQKTQALTRLQERDVEIEKLRRQITSKHVASSTEVELETRLRSLTEALIQKQTNIESLSTQNKSLQLQLERSQTQVRELEGCAPPPSERAPYHSEVGSDSVRLRTPTFLAETPWDGSVTRRVKRAYSSLDACSVRMGVFLKRYPIARIFVLGYMCLLHLWVMIVLFTYTPEIHGEDFHRTFSPQP
ncbi:Golgin subfamily A member 5 [Amphibalanus amphitrite]|uniref:Golgin subfamily A member 5 n=1 Tax=Amphibalanus amphitrite TaxID=1232801 RepID=A0A6A4VA03_AMPAM|nr:Golgin subfamily A member 5 [Amphibalanus amphitrite]